MRIVVTSPDGVGEWKRADVVFDPEEGRGEMPPEVLVDELQGALRHWAEVSFKVEHQMILIRSNEKISKLEPHGQQFMERLVRCMLDLGYDLAPDEPVNY